MKLSLILKFVAALGLLALVAGCAKAPGEDAQPKQVMYQEVYDPLEPMNRYFFDVNYALDALFLKPVSEIYRGVLPNGVRQSVRNFLTNLSQPIYLINNLLQGEVNRAGDNMGAFFINTFMGVGGLFDVAQLDTQEEDMGQTFAVWGVPEGPYLVIPLLGPNTSREAVGGVIDYFADPVNEIARKNDLDNLGIYRFVLSGIDARSRSIEALDEIEKNSIDFYATIRSLYRQNRANLILNGKGNPAQLPDMTFDEDESPQTKKN